MRGKSTLLKSTPCTSNPLMNKDLHSVYASCNQKVYRGQCSLADKQYFEFVMNNMLTFQNEEVHIDETKFNEIFANNSINGPNGNTSVTGVFGKEKRKISHLKSFSSNGLKTSAFDNKDLPAAKFFYTVFMPFNANGPFENNYMLLSFHPLFRNMWKLSRQGEARAMQRLHDIAIGKEGFILQHQPIPYTIGKSGELYRFKDFLAFCKIKDPAEQTELRNYWLGVYKDILLMPELARCAVAPNTPRTECWNHHNYGFKTDAKNTSVGEVDSQLTGYIKSGTLFENHRSQTTAVEQLTILNSTANGTSEKPIANNQLGEIGKAAYVLAGNVTSFETTTKSFTAKEYEANSSQHSLQHLLDVVTSIRIKPNMSILNKFTNNPTNFVAHFPHYGVLDVLNEKLVDFLSKKRIRETYNDLYSKVLLRKDIAERVESAKTDSKAENILFAATHKCKPVAAALDIDLTACYLKMEMDYVDAKVSPQNPFDILSEEGMLRRLDGALERWGPKYSLSLGFSHATHNKIMGVYTDCVNYCVSKSSPAMGNYKIGQVRTKMAFPLLASNRGITHSSLESIYDVLSMNKGKRRSESAKSVAVVDMTRYSDGYGLYRYAPPQALHLKMRQLFTENSVQNGVQMLGTCIRADAGGRKLAMKTGAKLQSMSSIGLSIPVLPKHVVHIHMTNNDKLVWVVDRSKLKYMVSAPTWKMAGERSASGGFKVFDHNAADRHAAVSKGLFPHAVSPLNPTTNFRKAYLATYKYAMEKTGATCNIEAIAEDLLGSNSLGSMLMIARGKSLNNSKSGRLSIDPKTNSFYADLTQ